jgi:hypothetical protein
MGLLYMTTVEEKKKKKKKKHTFLDTHLLNIFHMPVFLYLYSQTETCCVLIRYWMKDLKFMLC